MEVALYSPLNKFTFWIYQDDEILRFPLGMLTKGHTYHSCAATDVVQISIVIWKGVRNIRTLESL